MGRRRKGGKRRERMVSAGQVFSGRDRLLLSLRERQA
jgi:hypothetical protein